MPNPMIVIPTYWKSGDYTQDDTVYDHPTDLQNPEETLSKTLISLNNISDPFDVLLIGCPTRPSIGREMDKTIERIVKKLELRYSLSYFGAKQFQVLKNELSSIVSSDIAKIPSNQGYSNVRNLCLLIPHILDRSVVILLDDDEIVTDSYFVLKATEFIGKTIKGKILGMVAGYYVHSNGTFLNDETKVLPWERVAWNKLKWMNEAFKIISDPSIDRLVDTPFAFGGNIVICKECWSKVPFDPKIRRGEDMDYLRNVKHAEFVVKLDRELKITHCPPSTKNPYLLRLREDIFRFIYAKAKLKALDISPNESDPYPGYFLKNTEGKVLITELLYNCFNNDSLITAENRDQFFDKLKTISCVFNEAVEFANNYAKSYPGFQENWQLLLSSELSKISKDIVQKLK